MGTVTVIEVFVELYLPDTTVPPTDVTAPVVNDVGTVVSINNVLLLVAPVCKFPELSVIIAVKDIVFP